MTRSALSLLAALTLATPALAFDPAEMTAQERADFGAAVRSYLLENPQVIMEAVAVLEARNTAAQAENEAQMVARNAAALFDSPADWVGGNPEGDVTLVEFLDYRCGYCRRAHDEVQALLAADGNIRLVVKEFPILGEGSVLSSRYAVATLLEAGDAAYEAVHNALISLEADPSMPVLTRMARTLGLDADAIRDRMDDPQVIEILRANRDLANQLEINGTPTFVLGDQLLRGYVPLAQMQALVERTREEG